MVQKKLLLFIYFRTSLLLLLVFPFFLSLCVLLLALVVELFVLWVKVHTYLGKAKKMKKDPKKEKKKKKKCEKIYLKFVAYIYILIVVNLFLVYLNGFSSYLLQAWAISSDSKLEVLFFFLFQFEYFISFALCSLLSFISYLSFVLFPLLLFCYLLFIFLSFLLLFVSCLLFFSFNLNRCTHIKKRNSWFCIVPCSFKN